MRKKKRKAKNAEQLEVARTKDFFDCIAPTTIRFYSETAIGAYGRFVSIRCPQKCRRFLRGLVTAMA